MTPQEQIRVALAMVLCGALLAMVYDALWLLRRVFFPGKAAQAMADLLFWILCACAMIKAALFMRVEVFRLYVLGSVLCGMALYRISGGFFLRRVAGLAKKVPKRNKN